MKMLLAAQSVTPDEILQSLITHRNVSDADFDPSEHPLIKDDVVAFVRAFIKLTPKDLASVYVGFGGGKRKNVIGWRVFWQKVFDACFQSPVLPKAEVFALAERLFVVDAEFQEIVENTAGQSILPEPTYLWNVFMNEEDKGEEDKDSSFIKHMRSMRKQDRGFLMAVADAVRTTTCLKFLVLLAEVAAAKVFWKEGKLTDSDQNLKRFAAMLLREIHIGPQCSVPEYASLFVVFLQNAA